MKTEGTNKIPKVMLVLKWLGMWVSRFISRVEMKLILPFTITMVLLLSVIAYVSFKNISDMTTKNVQNSTMGLIKQTAKNIDTVYTEIDKQAMRISYDEKITTLMGNYENIGNAMKIESNNKIRNLLKDYTSSNPEFVDIYAYTNHEIFYSGDGAIYDSFWTSYAVTAKKKTLQKSIWIDTFYTDQSGTKMLSPKVITLIKSMYVSSSLKSVGTLIINIKEKHLQSLLEDIDLGYNGKVFLVGAKGNMVMDPVNLDNNCKKLGDDYIQEILGKECGSFTRKVNGVESLVTYCTVERTGWKLIGIMPKDNITSFIVSKGIQIFLIVILCLVIGLVLSVIFSYRTSRLMEKVIEQRTSQLTDALDNLKKAQNQLVQSEKMASIGILVSGVAHEINTPVGISVTAASHLNVKTKELTELLTGKSIKLSEILKYTDIMNETADVLLINLKRASDLIKSFKQIAVDQAVEEKRNFHVKQYINEVILSLKPTIKKIDITFNINCDEDLTIKTYAGSFAQVVTNLVMNSFIHAFEGYQQGKIDMDVSLKDDKIQFVYSDNGKGIEKDTLKKIYDPFYTTKRGHGGTGLGMYIVYNIVTQKLGGEISCTSELNHGTTFSIKFPVA